MPILNLTVLVSLVTLETKPTTGRGCSAHKNCHVLNYLPSSALSRAAVSTYFGTSVVRTP